MKRVLLFLAFLGFSQTMYGAVEESKTQLAESPEDSRIGSYAAASFIYWTPRVDGLTYAQTGRNSFQTISSGNLSSFLDLRQGKDLMVNWQWEPGFKANLGWDFRSQWQINLEYTWLYSKAKGSKSGLGIFPNIEIFPLDLVSTLGEVDRAKATWSLHYQLLHLELGREYRYTSALKFRTSFGLSLTYQTQDFSTLYVIPPFDISFNQTSITSTQQLNFNSKMKQDVFGTGLRLSFAPKWYLIKWFGFQGKAGISYLWMYYELKRRDSVGANIPLDGSVTGVKARLANIRTKPRAMKLLFDVNLGIFFETPTFYNQYRFNFFLGWESNIWVNETLQINLSDELSRFDLTMQGLTTRLQLDF